MKIYIIILLLFNIACMQAMEGENFSSVPKESEEETSNVTKIENLVEQQAQREEEDNSNLLLLVTQLGATQDALSQRVQDLEKMCDSFSKENKRLHKEIDKRNEMLDSIVQLVTAQNLVHVKKVVRAESETLFKKIKNYLDNMVSGEGASKEDTDVEKEDSE